MSTNQNGHGTGTYAHAVDTVSYELAPYLNQRGAHIWVEEVTYRTFVLGYSCWADAARDELWSWLQDRLRKSLKERVYKDITFLDYSTGSPTRA